MHFLCLLLALRNRVRFLLPFSFIVAFYVNVFKTFQTNFKTDGKEHYVIQIPLTTYYPAAPPQPGWLHARYQMLGSLRPKRLLMTDLQLTELFKQVFGFKKALANKVNHLFYARFLILAVKFCPKLTDPILVMCLRHNIRNFASTICPVYSSSRFTGFVSFIIAHFTLVRVTTLNDNRKTNATLNSTRLLTGFFDLCFINLV